MNLSTRSQLEEQWSARSQRSLLREAELRRGLASIDAAIIYTENQIAEEERVCSEMAQPSVSNGDYFLHPALQQRMSELRNSRDYLALCKEQRAKLQAEIDALYPNEKQAEARLENQQRLLQLVSERLERDRETAGFVKHLHRVLAARAELTTKIADACAAIELVLVEDGLDARRFDELLAALPADLLAASQRWEAVFTGKQEGLKTYIVRAERIVLPETLASNGVFRFGELVELTEAQASELLREGYPSADPACPWRRAPSQIIDVEEFEAAVEAAKKEGVPKEGLRAWMNARQDAEKQRRYVENQPRQPEPVRIY